MLVALVQREFCSCREGMPALRAVPTCAREHTVVLTARNVAPRFFEGAGIQKLFLAALLILVFWHGLFAGVPRADQVLYFYHAAKADGAVDLLMKTLEWNRVTSQGDEILFRPVLYLQLGLSYLLFGHSFVLWQIASLALHIAVVLSLFDVFRRGYLAPTAAPFLVCALFGVSALGSELVLWNHLGGYLLFALLELRMVLLLLRYFESRLVRDLAWAASLGLVAQFAYEFGVVINLLVMVVFLGQRFIPMARSNLRQSAAPALVFLAVALLYPCLSLAHLYLRGIVPSESRSLTLGTIYVAGKSALNQIGFWVSGVLAPTFYQLISDTRLHFRGLVIDESWQQWLNVGAVIALAGSACAALVIHRKSFFDRTHRSAVVAAACALLVLFAYSWIIAFGRAVPPGTTPMLFLNIYYSYIAMLVISLGVALTANRWHQPSPPGGDAAAEPGTAGKNRLLTQLQIIKCFYVAMGGLILLNAINTANIAKSFRYQYALPREVLLYLADAWHARHSRNPNAYFVLDNCTEKYAMPWLGTHLKIPAQAGVPSLADALYPRQSFLMNRIQLVGKTAQTGDICVPVRAKAAQ